MSAIVLKIRGFLKTSGMVAFAHSLRNDGFKKTVKRYGWKFFAILFTYYLVRDITIYIVLPWLIARNFING
jgi:hypothetical protein